MNKPKAPYISDELLQFLDSTFPEKTPDPKESLEEIRHRGGQVSVVRFLKHLQKQQTARELTGV
jgi:hypothetical protein